MAHSGNPTPAATEDYGGDWLRFRDDAPADEPAVSLDAFLYQTNATSVRIEAGEDVMPLLPHRHGSAASRRHSPRSRPGSGCRYAP